MRLVRTIDEYGRINHVDEKDLPEHLFAEEKIKKEIRLIREERLDIYIQELMRVCPEIEAFLEMEIQKLQELMEYKKKKDMDAYIAFWYFFDVWLKEKIADKKENK